MTAFLLEVCAWLTDYYAAATVLLLLMGMVRACVRQPVERMVLAWTTLGSLALLIILCASPAWPRMTLRPVPSSPPVVTPPATAISQGVPRRIPMELPRTSSLRDPSERTSQFLSHQARTDSPAPVASSVPRFPWRDTQAMVALGFLAGGLSVVMWELVGLIQIRRLKSRGQTPPDVAHRELERLVPNGTRLPELLVSPHISAALAFGVLRPTIVLPAYAVSPEGSEESSCALERLRSLLAHEWAHLSRGDLWLLGLARLLLIVLYAHPLYWWLRRMIRIDQELLADAAAAEYCGREVYAESLVTWARLLPQPRMRLGAAIGMWESPGQLTRRIAMLLNEQMTVRTKCTRRWQWSAGLTTLALVLGLSLVTLRPGRTVHAAEPPVIELQSATSQKSAVPVVETGTETDTEKSTPGKKKGILDIDGVCLDEQKRPLADVRLLLVFVNYDDGSQQDLQEIRSDAQGRFRFAPFNAGKLFAVALQDTLKHLYQLPARKLVVIAQTPGRATTMRLVAAAKPDLRTLEIVMPQGQSLRGRIVDDEGHPIAGVTVMVNQPTRRLLPGILHTVTDADGRYEIADLAEWDQDAAEKARRAKYEVVTEQQQRETLSRGYGLLRHPEYADLNFQFKVIPSTQDFQLSRPAAVEGQVTFEETGKPAAKVQIQVNGDRSRGLEDWQTVVTNADGRYSIPAKLLPRMYDIEARLDGWPKVIAREVPLKSGKNVVDIKLKTGGIIKGRLIEVGTGKPVTSPPGHFTLVQAADVATKSDYDYQGPQPDGTFEFSVPPGKIMLVVSTIGLGKRNHHEHRWILAGNDRQPAQIVNIAKGETKQVELRLLKASSGFDELMESDDEQRTKMEQLLASGNSEKAPVPVKTQTKNIAELAATAAIIQLGGSVKTEQIDGQECVVSVDMAMREVNGESVENDQFTDEALFYLRKFPRLKSLTLSRGQISDKGLENLRGLEHLEFVCLMYGWGLTDAGVAHVAALPNLQRFCTHAAEQLTDVSLQHLGQAVNLKDVSIDGGRISDAGLKHLQSLKHLNSLGIRSPDTLITDEGLQALAGHTELEALGLENTLITNAGLKHLHGLKKLTSLSLGQSKVTPEGLAELQKTLPKLELEKGTHADHADHSKMHD